MYQIRNFENKIQSNCVSEDIIGCKSATAQFCVNKGFEKNAL